METLTRDGANFLSINRRITLSQYERTPGEWRSCIVLDARRDGLFEVEDIDTGECTLRTEWEVR